MPPKLIQIKRVSSKETLLALKNLGRGVYSPRPRRNFSPGEDKEEMLNVAGLHDVMKFETPVRLELGRDFCLLSGITVS